MKFLDRVQANYKISADSQLSNYYVSQIQKIIDHAKDSEYPAQIVVSHEGEKTKYMSIPLKVLEDLKASYQKHTTE